LNELFQSLVSLDPSWVYVAIFVVAFIENLFPPAPSDVMVVFGGALAAMEKGNLIVAYFAGTIGSTCGFITMFLIGRWFGERILEQGKIKFIRRDKLHQFEGWFKKYGFWLIIANRFLTGTRAVVSFFAGISELDFKKTTILSFISSSLWYGILVYVGYSLGQHWENIGTYLKTYSIGISVLIALAVIGATVRYFFKKNKLKNNNG
jgi:membrane protein DedA with SNARE-associated domain